MKIGETEVLTLIDVEKRIEVSASTLRKSAEAGTLAATKMGKTWLVTVEEVDRYRRENKGKPGRKPKNGGKQ